MSEVLELELPSLEFRVSSVVHGAEAGPLAWLRRHRPTRPARFGADVTLEVQVVDEEVGLPSSPMVEATAVWSGWDQIQLRTTSARAELRFQRGAWHGRAEVHLPHARGGLEGLLRAVTTLALSRKQVLLIHASAVVRGEGAVLFLGPSGAGKTTTARRLKREGLLCLAEDMIALDLRRESPRVHRVPFERGGKSLARAHEVEPAPCCLGAAVIEKGASKAALHLAPDRASLWSDARISLPPGPRQTKQALVAFERLCAIPLYAFAVPRRGPLLPTISAWVDELRRSSGCRRLDNLGPGVQASPMSVSSASAGSSSPFLMRDPNVAWRVVDGAAVLVAPFSPKIHSLNPVGTLVWELADGRPVEQIVEAVVEQFEVGSEQARTDVEAFLRDLTARELLVSGNQADEHRKGR